MNNSEVIKALKELREDLTASLNEVFDKLLDSINNMSENDKTLIDFVYPLSAMPELFIGKKPTAVISGMERVEVKTWRGVFTEILTHCNAETVYHEKLMFLRNKVLGKVRVLVSDKPDGMKRPLKLEDDLFFETHLGTAELIRILTNRILDEVGYDYSGISVAIRDE